MLSLAPDASARRAARGLAGDKAWCEVGISGGDDLPPTVWGLCQGSGSDPYQTCVDLTEPAYKCTCPSRKFPCKHTLAILLRWADGGVPEAPAPAWVRAWQESRVTRATARETSAARTGGEGSGRAAGEKAATRRAGRVAAGLVELDRWLADQVRNGLTTGPAGYARWDAMGARLIDAQAPGAARLVRNLADHAGDPDRLLAEIGLLRLLTSGYARLDALPDALAATLRLRVGLPVSAEEVLAGPPVRDRWQVIGVHDKIEVDLIVRRVWLRGASTGRAALVLSFAGPGQVFVTDLVVGTALDADLCFYPERVRVLIAKRHAPAAPMSSAEGAAAGARGDAGVRERARRRPLARALADAGRRGRPRTGRRRLVPGARRRWWRRPARPGGGRALAARRRGRRPSGDRRRRVDGRRSAAAQRLGRRTAGAAVSTAARTVDPPATWAEVLASALVGTARSGGVAGAVLDTVAALALRRRAGVALVDGDRPEPAPADDVPTVGPAAAARADALLALDNATRGALPVKDMAARLELLAEWLAAATAVGRRVPPELVPALLEAARRHRDLRPYVAAAGGPLAGWLAAQRPEWGFATDAPPAPPTGADEQVWELGPAHARAAFLRHLRRHDPRRAYELLDAAWESETPDDRISAAAQPRRRADRRRRAAAGAGPRRPAQAGARDRARPARRRCPTRRTPPAWSPAPGRAWSPSRRRRGRRRPARRAATGTCAATASRPGRPPAPASAPGGSRRCWPAHRCPTWPADLLDRRMPEQWIPTVRRGLARAAAAQRDPVWAAALVDRLADDAATHGRPDDRLLVEALYDALPADDLTGRATAALRRGLAEATAAGVDHVLALLPRPWPPGVADAVFEAIEGQFLRRGGGWRVAALCELAALRLPADLAPGRRRWSSATARSCPPTRAAPLSTASPPSCASATR